MQFMDYVGQVVVILPYVGDRILLQLRDDKPDIAFPGHWGFFGGSAMRGETLEEAGRRELFEEIGFKPEKMHFLQSHVIRDCNNLVSHAFYCPLTVPLDQLALAEGADWGLATVREIQGKRIYSERLQGFFPVATTYYIEYTALKTMEALGLL